MQAPCNFLLEESRFAHPAFHLFRAKVARALSAASLRCTKTVCMPFGTCLQMPE